MSAPRLPIQPGPDQPAPARVRRFPTAALSVQDEQRALVRHIAADPLRVGWLREHVAAHLDRAAERLAESTLADLDAAEVLHGLAGAHRRGETPLW